MLWKTCTVFVTALVLSGTSYLALAGDADKKALQGTWNATKGDEKMQMVIDGNKFTLQMKGKKVSGTFTTDPTKKPKSIDMLVLEVSDEGAEKYKGKTSQGIYEIDGNKLKWCASEPGKDERPAVMPESDAKTKTLFLIFERAKK
jgi:uncharacterized protein (TIGR03067 family)